MIVPKPPGLANALSLTQTDASSMSNFTHSYRKLDLDHA
jgi:hypothetical protein